VFLHFVPSASNIKGNFHNFGTVSYIRGKLGLELQFLTLCAGHCWTSSEKPFGHESQMKRKCLQATL